jgi:ubiquinone/menaquinone biosynthesis C-methylase UbiE
MQTNGNENTYVIDPESAAEMGRLMDQDLLLTRVMGELLPEQVNPSKIHAILDIACGPGGWALEVAFAYPNIEVMGIDISRAMIEYARMRARTQHLSNAGFLVMNALAPLEFLDDSFDLVNARFLTGFMSPAAWPKLVRECMRITRPGGAIQITEVNNLGMTTSPAFEKLNAMALRAYQLVGRTFSPEEQHNGVLPLLGRMLREAGFQHIQLKAHVLDFSKGAEAYNGGYQNIMTAVKLLQPFLVKTGVGTQEEVEALYQQMLEEMKAEDFCALSFFLSVYGEKP